MFILPLQPSEMWTGIYSGGGRALSHLTGVALALNDVPNLFLVHRQRGFGRQVTPESQPFSALSSVTAH